MAKNVRVAPASQDARSQSLVFISPTTSLHSTAVHQSCFHSSPVYANLSPKLLSRLEFDPWTSLPVTALLVDLGPPPLEVLHEPRVGKPKEDHHHRDGQS